MADTAGPALTADLFSPEPVVKVFGVRHHGPGSARAVVRALDDFEPDVVLVEGPADADPLTALVANPELVPPVALLAYAADQPKLSAFWPMAVFSPEWQALSWAAAARKPAHFIDLPATAVLAEVEATETSETSDDDASNGDERIDGHRPVSSTPVDPILALAQAAGYDDPERWWEDVIEARRDGERGGKGGHDPFDAITEAMAEIRQGRVSDPVEARREAQMRQGIRTALKAGHTKIAVVCGAWHAPALTTPLPPAAGDARLLRGLAKHKAQLTWVPWTHSRLSYASGYGAGISSPGWYSHLFTTGEHVTEDWLTKVAAELRLRDLPISTAHVIEATRLAHTLAILRGRPVPGLSEVNDATRAVICDGDDALLALIVRDLVVGEAIGAVPDDTPTVPLESDLAASCRRLRFKRDPSITEKDFDLRKPGDLERSALLHRLRLLGIGWGTPSASMVRSTGTFRETWRLQWRPEFAVDVIDASVWGTSVADAAGNKAISDALGADLPGLTRLIEVALLADLGDALPDLLAALDTRAARDHDVLKLMAALPPLVRAHRYGDVRGTDLSSLTRVIDGLLVRVCAGLGQAMASLDEEGAGAALPHLNQVHDAVALYDDDPARERWLRSLHSLIARADIHPLLLGRLVRLLLDAGVLDHDDAAARLHRALSLGSEPAAKAAWVEGFLSGTGLLLVHDRVLLSLLDEWLSGLGAEDFGQVVPLLRRTFSRFEAGERRQIGDAVKTRSGDREPEAVSQNWSPQRAVAAVTTAAALLGLRPLSDLPGTTRQGSADE